MNRADHARLNRRRIAWAGGLNTGSNYLQADPGKNQRVAAITPDDCLLQPPEVWFSFINFGFQYRSEI